MAVFFLIISGGALLVDGNKQKYTLTLTCKKKKEQHGREISRNKKGNISRRKESNDHVKFMHMQIWRI
jgi:hypothetical protein